MNAVQFPDMISNNKIIVRKQNGSIIINGTNLVVSKLLNDEILIDGKISNIEFR